MSTKSIIMDNKVPEQIQDRVSSQDLWKEVTDVISVYPSSTAIAMIKYFAPLIEAAYIAGANHVNITTGYVQIKDTGDILTNARVFVKDKGFEV